MRFLRYVLFFGLMAGIGIVLGCYVHGLRTNQPTLMSGVAFVRELPQGELIVGYIETAVFSYQEKKSLEKFKEENQEIKIDPEVLKKHKDLYGSGQKNN